MLKLPILILLSLLITNVVFTQNHKKEIDSLLKAYSEFNQFNGNVIVIKDEKTTYCSTYQINNPLSYTLNKETAFPIGSLSKSFTALVILKLQEEHKLSLEDKLSKYILCQNLKKKFSLVRTL